MNLQTGLNQGILFETPTETFIELCGKWEIRNIELRVPKLREWVCRDSVSKIRKVLRDNKITITALNSLDDFGLVPDENLGLLAAEAEWVGRMCEAVECPLVIAPVGRWFDAPIPLDQVRRLTLERLDLLSRTLAPCDAVVGLEPIAFPEFSIQSVHMADSICQEARIPGSGLVIDFYNLFQGGMIPNDFPKLKSPIHIIHLNDAEMLPPEKLDVMYSRTFPGDGKLDAEAWTLAALKAGYTGVFSLELFLRDLWQMEPDAAMFKIAGKLQQFTENIDTQLAKELEL